MGESRSEMYTAEDLEKAYKLFANEFRKKLIRSMQLIVNHHYNASQYTVTNVKEDRVIILQNETPKNHLKNQLKELFISNKFKKPNGKGYYFINDLEGDIPMKAAIVTYLRQLLRERNRKV